MNLIKTVEKFERGLIVSALKENQGLRKVAKNLGISHQVLFYKMKKYKIQRAKGERTLPGYIYIIKCNNLYKIGRTINPNQRVCRYSTENPFPTENILLAKVNNMCEAERALHYRFREKRVKGEWFSLDKNDLGIIKQYISLV